MSSKRMDKMTETPWAVSAKNLPALSGVNADYGLDEKEAYLRLKRFGPNSLRIKDKKSIWKILFEQFKSVVFVLLLIAAAFSFALDETIEGMAVMMAVSINVAIGFITELKAVRSMEALRKLGKMHTRVLREGRAKEIPAQKLVPGDIVLIEPGDIMSADVRLLEASKIYADESMLTGESMSAGKKIASLKAETTLSERNNMLFKGTAVTRGSGKGLVTATGMRTELGQISALVEEAEEEITPLEKRLNKTGYRLIWFTIAVTSLVALGGIIKGKDLYLMVETSIALSVAAIPEGLPIVATIALARGMLKMARRNALMNRLAAVETLGATSIICTDKTGTLTENRMTVSCIGTASAMIEISGKGKKDSFLKDGKEIKPSENRPLMETLNIAALCNNVTFKEKDEKKTGDPLEIALLEVTRLAGIEKKRLLKAMPEVREEAFDPETKMMATFHKLEKAFFVAVKGAPEAVIDASTYYLTGDGLKKMDEEGRNRWRNMNEDMARRGLRVIAAAEKEVEERDDSPYEGLTITALIGMFDPPRRDVKKAIGMCKQAGMKVIMVTGDQPATAKHVASVLEIFEKDNSKIMIGTELGDPHRLSEAERQRIIETVVFARIAPSQKLDIIRLHQENRSIVAMTGDGVNDAPALKKADIGIAMGRRGTQVAQESADMILKDDAFGTIAVAIKEGRIIFDNIRSFIFYLISGNLGEVLVVAAALLATDLLPILPLQILYLNMVVDVFPALALGLGKGNPSIMQRPPRDAAEPFLTNRHWIAIMGYGLIITFATLLSLLASLHVYDMNPERALTVSFLTLAFGRLFHVFNMREKGTNILKNRVTSNPFIWGALILCTVLLLATLYFSPLARILETVDPEFDGWVLVVFFSLLPLLTGQIVKAFPSFRQRVAADA